MEAQSLYELPKERVPANDMKKTAVFPAFHSLNQVPEFIFFPSPFSSIQ